MSTAGFGRTGRATLLGFGVDYEELVSGPASFTAGIVEWPDGFVELIPLRFLRFQDVSSGPDRTDVLVNALRTIVKQDSVELTLDPGWAQRVARIALTEAGLG